MQSSSCYRRYVDKIGSNTILLLSSIPYHWIGTMGRCQLVGTGDQINKYVPDFLSSVAGVCYNHASIAKIGGVDPCRGWHKM